MKARNLWQCLHLYFLGPWVAPFQLTTFVIKIVEAQFEVFASAKIRKTWPSLIVKPCRKSENYEMTTYNSYSWHVGLKLQPS